MVKGVITRTGAIYNCKSVILATGTYLKGRIFMGEVNYESGPDGMFPSILLSDALKRKRFSNEKVKNWYTC